MDYFLDRISTLFSETSAFLTEIFQLVSAQRTVRLMQGTSQRWRYSPLDRRDYGCIVGQDRRPKQLRMIGLHLLREFAHAVAGILSNIPHGKQASLRTFDSL